MSFTFPSANGTVTGPRAGSAVPPAAPPGGLVPILSNVSNDQPLRLGDLCAHMFHLTGRWPVLVAGSLCVPVPNPRTGRWRVEYLTKPAEFIAWLDRYAHVRWSRKSGANDKAEFFHSVRQHATPFGWATDSFHVPCLQDVVYVNPAPAPAKTGALDELVDLFSPHTPADRRLLKALFLTPFWGGPPGKRPLFAVTTADTGADRHRGRGSGKSTVAHVAGRLAGGYLSVSRRQDRDRLVSDLLSPQGPAARVVLMDNVKALKFSSEDLEAMVTATTIDGHVMYGGHGSRPNYMTYILTANEPSLSTDFASRAVPIEVRPSKKSAAWDERLEGLLADPVFLERLYADIAYHLLLPPERYVDDPDDRWPLWWKHVGLAACGTPEALAEARAVVRERRGELDADRATVEALAEAIRDLLLRARVPDPDKSVVFLATAVFAPAVSAVLGRRELPLSEVGKWIGSFNPEYLHKEKNGPPAVPKGPNPRGYWWVGPSCSEDGPVPAYVVREPKRGCLPGMEPLNSLEGRRIVDKFRSGPVTMPSRNAG